MSADAKVELLTAADGLDHVSAALQEVHALSGMGDGPFDASMFGQIAAVERGASLLRRSALEAPHSMTEAMGRDIYKQGYKDGFVDATITEDGYPDEVTVLKRVSGANIAEGWDAYRDTAMQAAR